MTRPRRLTPALVLLAVAAYAAACGDGATEPPPTAPDPSEITVHNPDRAALVALYNATDGPNWVDNENWLSDAPLSEWYGVSTDASGRVVGLELLGRWDNDRREYVQHGLSGPIPAEVGNLASLRTLNLATNSLTGPIPSELGELANLSRLHLSGNSLTGPIPASLGELTQMIHLTLDDNGLSGGIPSELGKLANLKTLGLCCNELTGPIPAELANLKELETFQLFGNRLTGAVPAWLGELSRLVTIDLIENQLTGPIPPEIGGLPNLRSLFLAKNQLSGPIPPELGNLSKLRTLEIEYNRLNGPIPAELGNLASLSRLGLGSNELNGAIPPELGKLAPLEVLSLGSNSLSGVIPPELGQLTDLVWMGLDHNSLSGVIPPELGNLTRLTALRLGRNDLSGTIPPELRNLAALEYFDTDGNPQLCPPADEEFLAWLREKGAGPFPCRDPNDRLLPGALMREDGNGMSLALPDDLRNEVTLTVSDTSVVAASVADGYLALSPRGRGTAEVEVVPSDGGHAAIAEVAVRAAVGTFGIDIVLDQSGTARYGEAMVAAADWWSEMLDGTEWPDRRSGCPHRDPFAGKVTALADELLIWARVDATAGAVVGYADGCFFPTVADGVPALDPGGGSVVVGAAFVTSEVLLRHEIGHLLGLVLWPPATGLKTENGAYFTGPRAVEAFRAGGGDPGLPGVPMADRAHWHGETVAHELMEPQGGPVNSISLGALLDAGYTVDLSKAVPWPWRPPGRRKR